MPRKRPPRVGGLFTALITPFDRKGKVDLNALVDLVRFQVSKGAEGLFPCGSTGQGPLLRPEERKRVAEVVMGSAGKVPVVVQVGSSDTATTIELAKHAEKIGAEAVASLTPYYYKPGEGGVARHFEAVSGSVGIPLFAYNIPQFTGNNFPPAAAADLAKKGVIAGIKDSSRDFLQVLELLDLTPEDFVVMNGVEEYALLAILSGADGVVSGGANAYPELLASLVRSHRRGNLKGSVRVQEEVRAFKGAVRSNPIGSYYAILKERGIDCGDPRPPVQPLDAGQRATLRTTLKRLKVPLGT